METVEYDAIKSRGAGSIASVDETNPLRELVQYCATKSAPCQALLDALQRCAGTKAGSYCRVDRVIEGLADSKELPWIITTAYSQLHRKENSLRDGTVFTPPWLANEVVKCLLPGLTVVDLGAGSGMLTIAAALKGFNVVAIEEDQELAMILESLIQIMQLQKRIELRVCDALSYSRCREGQIMANPPFTRHHSIPIQKKQMLARMATELGLPLPMTTGYYGYFMAYAWASKWSKRDVFLLPTNWLEARYGRSLRQMLLARNYGISLVENGHHSPVFDHALTTICLVITWPKHSVRNDGELAGTINVLRGPNERNIKNQISNDELAACLGQRLSNFVQGERKADHAVADVLRVRRGIATGNNEFFILSKASARTLGIGRRELIEILRRFPSDSRSIEVAYLWAPTEKPSEASLRRIAEGEKLRVNQRYLCRHRKPWWRIKVHSPPAYLLAYMGRGTPRIIENRDGLLNLNNTHGLYLREKVPTGLAMNTVEWLGSEEGIEALNNQARHYYGGLWKLEPGDVERISLPTSLF